MIEPNRRRKTCWLCWALGGTVALAVAVLALIPPLVTGPIVNRHVAFAQVWDGREQGLSPERLVLRTADGLQVVAYAVSAPDPKAVVIFLSGIHNPSVTAFFGHAAMLQEEGYSSILLEMRAHGESEGDVIGLGYTEHQDVRAAVEHVRNTEGTRDTPIVLYGLSMGGAVAIVSTGLISEVDGLISLSAYSSWEDAFLDNMGATGLLAALQRPFVRLYTTLKYGWRQREATPLRQIRNLGDRPALLVHSREDSQVPYASLERLRAQAPEHVETWVREGDLHLIVQEGLFLEPQRDVEYAERIVGFLKRHFGR